MVEFRSDGCCALLLFLKAKALGSAAMLRYTFKLRDDAGGVEDADGVHLPNAEAAYCYACDVVRELMEARESNTRYWQLDVYEDGHKKIFEISFAEFDPTLDHLNPPLRDVVEHSARQIRSARDTYQAARFTMREAKSLVARSRGKPYLVSDRGRKVIRDET